MERNQFTFYRSYYEAVRELPKKEQSAVMLAICAYALDETEPALTGTAKAIFSLVRPTLDASRRKAASGKAGGERKQTASKPQAKPKQTAREKENKKENKKENECYTPIPPLGVFEEFSGGDADLLSALIAFETMRNKIKKPMSEDAKRRLVAKLQRMSSDKGIWIAVLNQSEDRCWADVYELKDNAPKGKPKNPNNMAGMNFQATPERVKKNGDWLDKFLAEQEQKEADNA